MYCGRYPKSPRRRNILRSNKPIMNSGRHLTGRGKRSLRLRSPGMNECFRALGRDCGVMHMSPHMNQRFTLLLLSMALCSCMSLAEVEGSYTTVTESECNEEIVLLPDALGKIINTCRLEDGSHKDEVKETDISWVVEGTVITVASGLESLTFSIDDSLSCADFGGTGHSPGIVGRGTFYWKRPISCR